MGSGEDSHYNEGLALVREGKEPERVDLSALDSMDEMLLDPTNGDVWVGGTNQLVRVRSEGVTWAKQSFRVK